MPLLLLTLTLVGAERCWCLRLVDVEVGWACVRVVRRGDAEELRYESQSLVRRGPAVVRLTAVAEATLAVDGRVRTLAARRTEGTVEVSRLDQRAVDAVPSVLAPAMLGASVSCVEAVEETTGRRGKVCGRRSGSVVSGDFLGTPFSAHVDRASALPVEIYFPAQQARFTEVPLRPEIPEPPELFSTPMALEGDLDTQAETVAFQVPLRTLPAAAGQRTAAAGDGLKVQWASAAPSGADPPRSHRVRQDDELSNEAARLTGSAGVWAATQALVRGVERRVADKRPWPGDDDAAAVFRNRRGTCRAHVVLFLALAQRAGIEARDVIGLAAADGRLYPHVWAEVRIGEKWYAVDPTEGAAPPRWPRIALGRGAEAGERLLALRAGRKAIRVADVAP